MNTGCSSDRVSALQRGYHALYDTGARLGGLSLKDLIIHYLRLIGLIRYGADDNKGLVVKIACLRYGGALHLTAHTAEVGDYLILLLLFGDELVSGAYPALKYADITRRILHSLHRGSPQIFIRRESILSGIRYLALLKAESLYVVIVLYGVGRNNDIAYIDLIIQRTGNACVDDRRAAEGVDESMGANTGVDSIK